MKKTPSKRGGARPNSGPRVNIEKNLILYDIALSFDVDWTAHGVSYTSGGTGQKW